MNYTTIKKMYEEFDESQKRAFATMIGFAVLHGIGCDIRDLGTPIKTPFKRHQTNLVRVFLGHVANQMKGE